MSDFPESHNQTVLAVRDFSYVLTRAKESANSHVAADLLPPARISKPKDDCVAVFRP